jgi:hypothetical protein
MKVTFILIGMLVWTSPLMAESYSWIDDSGTYNFTEDYSKVPKKYLKKVNKREDMGGDSGSKDSAVPSTAPKGSSASDSKKTDTGKPADPSTGLSAAAYDQWKQEFSDREAAMGTVKAKAKEIELQLSKGTQNAEQRKSLIAEHNALIGQFTELKKQYEQQVEKARKAGFQIEMSR